MFGKSMSDIKWRKGGLYGAITYVYGLIFTAVWFYLDHLGTLLQRDARNATIAEIAGLILGLFYRVQFVVAPETSIPYELMFDLGMLTALVFQAIPVVLLILMAGFFVYAEADASDGLEAALSGSSLVVGYLPLFIAVVLALRFSVSVKLPIWTAVLAGFLYPVTFGGLSGLIVNEVKNYRKGITAW